MKLQSATALGRIGSVACLAEVRKLAGQSATFRRAAERGTEIAFDFPEAAAFAERWILKRAARTVLAKRLNGLTSAAQSAALGGWLGQRDANYPQLRPPQGPETQPNWWADFLAEQLVELGAEGIAGLHAAFAAVRDTSPERRVTIVRQVVRSFGPDIDAFLKRNPDAKKTWRDGNLEERRALRQRAGQSVAEDIRSAARDFASAVIATPLRHRDDKLIFGLIVVMHLTDLDAEVMAFIRRTEDPEFRGRAFECLIELGTDAGLDFMVANIRNLGTARLHSEPEHRLLPRYLAALREECDAPWGPRFGSLSNCVETSRRELLSKNAKALEEICSRVEEVCRATEASAATQTDPAARDDLLGKALSARQSLKRLRELLHAIRLPH